MIDQRELLQRLQGAYPSLSPLELVTRVDEMMRAAGPSATTDTAFNEVVRVLRDERRPTYLADVKGKYPEVYDLLESLELL